MAPQPSILIDTNIIIEAARVGAFSRLRAHGGLVTVERCREEALSGKPGTRGRIVIAPDELCDPLSVVEVSQAGRVHVAILHPESSVLGDGERDLLVHAFFLARGNGGLPAGGIGEALLKAGRPVSNPGLFSIVTADQAAVRVSMQMGLGERLVSLESVMAAAGVKVDGKLNDAYTSARLSAWKTRHRLGM